MQMKILEKYLSEFGEIISKSNVTVVPLELANIKAIFEGIGKVSPVLPEISSTKQGK